MASTDTVTLNAPHAPNERAIEAFTQVLPKIKAAIVSSRRDWNKHEPRMWSRVSGLSDEELVSFKIEDDLVEISSGATSYGTLVFGKIRIPGVRDEAGEGFVHVRIHDPPNAGTEDVKFHSIFTNEIRSDGGEDGTPQDYQAVQTRETKLAFFNE